MTDIDLTAAIRPTSDAIYRQLSGQYGDFSTPSDEEAEAVLKAALPHILAQVEPRVTPSRDDIAQALINSDIIASDTRANAQIVGHNDREPFLCFADAVLALFNGKTEQEVRRAAYDDLIAELLSVTEDYVSITALSGIVDGLLARGGEGR